MVLNICELIRVLVPFDLSILVTWSIVAVAIAGVCSSCLVLFPEKTSHCDRIIPPIVVCVSEMPK